MTMAEPASMKGVGKSPRDQRAKDHRPDQAGIVERRQHRDLAVAEAPG